MDAFYPELPKPLAKLLAFINLINYCVSAVAFYLGLNPSFATQVAPWDDQVHQVFLSGSISSPTVPPAVMEVRLPVLKYVCHGEQTICAVCLSCLEDGDEVGELGNCRHVFHKGCIDEWMDSGKSTCPVCRSQLLPAEEREEEEEEALVI